MQYAIVMTLCAALNTPAERCDDYITDVLESLDECTIALAKTPTDAKRVVSLACVVARPDNATLEKVKPHG